MHSLTSTAGEASKNFGVTIIKIEKRSDPYARIDNRTLRDEHLSLKATGLLAVLLSLPPHWKVNVRHLAQMKADGLHAVQTGLEELERYSYARYERLKDSRGRFCGSVWRIFERPFTGKAIFPFPENPVPGEIRLPEKSAPINDIDFCTNKRERIKRPTADGKPMGNSSGREQPSKSPSSSFWEKLESASPAERAQREEFAKWCRSQRGEPTETGFQTWRKSQAEKDKGYVLNREFFTSKKANELATKDPTLALKFKHAIRRGHKVELVDKQA